MHIVHDTESDQLDTRRTGIVARTAAAVQAWRARQAGRRLSLNERLGEDARSALRSRGASSLADQVRDRR